ncbi:MAG: DUF2271 domain-containing protein [Bacteroidetes bacterium]|nr:DUF2271 domain-containing protein [Bacteroidota bacterium]
MKKQLLSFSSLAIAGFFIIALFCSSNSPHTEKQSKSTTGGEMTFTVRTVQAGGNYAPKHVLAIWVEDSEGFIKTRKAMANQRKQYLYTWKAASNYNVVDAITGSTLTSHQTHTVSWNFIDLEGNLVPDGEYTVWTEFTDAHAQGPLYTLTFEKGPDGISLTPADETYFKDIEFEFIPYTAEFGMDVTDICQWETVTFTDESINATSWEWNFGEGAAPATSTTQGPHTVYYTTPGVKTVSLTINGTVTETKEDLIAVTVAPIADFEFVGDALTVEFTNLSANATTYLWDFGDGNTSTDNNPVHTYAEAGSYNVNLTANYLECSDEENHEVSVPLVGLDQETEKERIGVYPNPAEGKFIVELSSKINQSGTIHVYNTRGSVIKRIETNPAFATGKYMIDLSNQPKGLYMIYFQNENEDYSTKILIK